VASSFDEPVELCALTSSEPQWIRAELKANGKGKRRADGGCPGGSPGGTVSLPAHSRGDLPVGEAVFWPDPPCDDAWHCLGRWANVVGDKAQQKLDAAAIATHRNTHGSRSSTDGACGLCAAKRSGAFPPNMPYLINLNTSMIELVSSARELKKH